MQSELKLSNISPLFTEKVLFNSAKIAYKKKYNNSDDDNIPEINNYTINFASSKGDGFLGIIYRINIIFKNEKIIRIIGKGMPEDIERRKTFQCEQFFAKEILFYNEVLPILRKFESEKHSGDSFIIVPDCYYAFSDGINDFIVMEDLLEDGYSMPEKEIGLNTTQTAAMFKMLAQFHGVSLALKYLQPEKFNSLTKGIQEPLFRKDQISWILQYLLNLSNVIIDAATDQISKEYMDKFKKFAHPDTYFDTMIGKVQNRDTVCVINHGDAWATNFMFNDKLGKSKAIDFQLLRVGSPMLDISTVIFACISEDERRKLGGVKGILDVYACALKETMTTLGAPEHTLTTEELLKLWHQFGAHGLGSAIELVPLSLADSNDIGKADEQPVALKLEDLSKYIEIKNIEGKKRLGDMISLAVNEGLI